MTNSIKILLSEIIDYAGLFPPSEVPVAIAVRNYAEYLRMPESWMLGRFILPISRLSEFIEAAPSYFEPDKLWRVSIIADDDDLLLTLKRIVQFNLDFKDSALIDMIELKVETAEEIREKSTFLPSDLAAYFEFPLRDVMTDFMTALAVTKNRAKIRTGGLTPDAFPPTDVIVKFMRICTAANVPFKATAGLHHPLRCTMPLSYQPNAPIGAMNGFLNVFLTACFLRQDLNNSFVHRLINDANSENFTINDEGIRWKDYDLSNPLITMTRLKGATSFGSCSFLEPIDDLRRLGLLEV